MPDILDTKTEDQELKKLVGECNLLEARMAEIMQELLLEIEKQKSDEVLACDTKESIKEITNRIFELKESLEE